MNLKRFEFLGRILSKYADCPDCIPQEQIVRYIKEYNNLLMQSEAEHKRNKDIERESKTIKTDIHFQKWDL